MAQITWYGKEALVEAAYPRLTPVAMVLDVGCGVRPQRYIPNALHLCIEPYLPYLTALRAQNPDGPNHLLLHATWETAMAMFLPQSVDTVVATDVIEHLDKEDGWRFLAEAERLARHQIVIFTPLGFHAQPWVPGQPDRWGMDGGYWQQHRSGWWPEEFGDGWEVLACEKYHYEDEHNQPLAEDDAFGAFYAIWTR